jgi:16S rRNA (uracil1498-N3)-methyltransferase
MLPLFIVDSIPNSGILEISGDEAKHAVTVLRINTGEQISITDGKGNRAQAQVKEVNRKSLLLEISKRSFEPAGQVQLVVAQALTKGDRARETIELLTEAGVDLIIPWNAQRSIGQWKDDAEEKWRGWAKEATKQSRRSWIPGIRPLLSSAELANEIATFNLCLLLHESADQKISLMIGDKNLTSILLIIGPEGGVSDDELELFKRAGANVTALGKPVFRSAHAGAVALAAVQTLLEIW